MELLQSEDDFVPFRPIQQEKCYGIVMVLRIMAFEFCLSKHEVGDLILFERFGWLTMRLGINAIGWSLILYIFVALD